MAFLKLAFEKERIREGKGPRVLFDAVRSDYAFLLESAGGGRYSYIGYDPFAVAWVENNTVYLMKKKNFFHLEKSGVKQIIDGDLLEVLRGLTGKFEFRGEAPVPFYGGIAGFFSYDYGCSLAGVKQSVYDDLSLPDFTFAFTDKVIAFDHEKGEVFYLATAETDTAAERKIGEIKNDLKRKPLLRRKGELGDLASNVSREQYLEKFGAIKELLKRGETYQVNYSQRFSADCTLDAYGVYGKLSDLNPSPSACYFEYPDFRIASCSPELLLRKRGRDVETWPIKGTVRRGADEKEDADLERELLDSGKDAAELNMIVDLERNDLGKVCEAGTVKVLEHRALSRYSHVIHTYSRVGGRLAARKDFFDVWRAVFPGGSITGCPKKRTMEIIDRLEDYKRGVYTGSAGFLSFSGDADFNILIRTMFLKDNRVYFQAGGGIVIGSKGEGEYRESLDKAEALVRALRA